MKYTLTVILLIVFSFTSITVGQVQDSSKYQLKQDLLRKSKRQKTTAFVMLGAGAVAAVTGTIMFNEYFDIWDDSNDALMGTGVVLATAGGLSMLGSIHFFIASSNNKKKAMAMSAGIKIENVVPDGVFRTNRTYYPSLSLRLNMR